MKNTILLPDLASVDEFVVTAGAIDDIVLVSREGFANQIDGASMLGMMALMGNRIWIDCVNKSEKFLRMLEKYKI